MEEEYRMQKVQAEISKFVNGNEGGVNGAAATDDNASTRAVISPGPTEESSPSATPIPTIRVTSESDHEKVKEAEAEADGEAPLGAAEQETLGKPEQAAAPEEGAEHLSGDSANLTSPEPFSFSNKRLCERWLDNLFMVLYEVCVQTMSVFGS